MLSSVRLGTSVNSSSGSALLEDGVGTIPMLHGLVVGTIVEVSTMLAAMPAHMPIEMSGNAIYKYGKANISFRRWRCPHKIYGGIWPCPI